MKKVIVHILNTVIIFSLVVLALTLKTGGFSIPVISLSCHHIQNPLIIFVLFWIVRLILTRKQGTSAIESRRKNLRVAGKTGVIIALFWLGSRIFPPHFGNFSLYLPQARYVPHPLMIFALSSLFIAGIAYLMYTLVKRLLGETTAIIAMTVFLFSSLCRTLGAGLFPSYTIIILLLGSAVHLSRYFAPNVTAGAASGSEKSRARLRGHIRPLITGLLFLLSALLFRYFWMGMSFKPQGLWEMVLFKQRLTTAMPLPGNHLLWIVPGVIILLRGRRRSYLVVLLAVIFLWTFFAADNNKLAAYLPMVCCLSILMGACLSWLVENKLTNRTVFDRNISFAVAATFFVLFYFNVNSQLTHWTGLSLYEAENLPGYGTIIQDRNASGGAAVLKEKDAARKEATVIYGPYHPFLSGEYEATFRLLAGDNTNPRQVAKIDVSSDYGNIILATKRIRGTDFSRKGAYEDFSLRFLLTERMRLEFRVSSFARIDLTVDEVSMKLLNRQELLSAPRHIPILMYHKVGANAPTQWWVRTADFREQMRALKKAGYRSVHLKDIYNHKMKKGNLPFHPVVVTFDDGYYNFLTEAFPALEEQGFTATLFIITGRTADTEARRMDNSCDGGSESRHRAEYLIWPEIVHLARQGVEIGSHTITHPNLTRLEKADLEKEIRESKTILENKLGMPVETFCYPGGKRNGAVIETVKNAGCKAAVIVYPGIENSETMDMFNLKRICIRPGVSAEKMLRMIAAR
jgi:peptidoglycan/xylan/chitin deacetylase (PgdA/CDA1 family)